MRKQCIIVGLGKYGKTIAKKLEDSNVEVLAVDSEDPNFETIVEINKAEGEVTAADIIHSNEVVVVNPEQHIATVSAGGNLHMFLTVRRGVGFVS